MLTVTAVAVVKRPSDLSTVQKGRKRGRTAAAGSRKAKNAVRRPVISLTSTTLPEFPSAECTDPEL